MSFLFFNTFTFFQRLKYFMVQVYNQSIFRNKDLWANYDQSGDIQRKLPKLFSHIPAEVESILDAGCGNGAITNHFPKKYRVVGIDSSSEALKFVTTDKILCSADNIPVGDRSFDMVFSSELIEHLPADILNGTINEFKRIARKYVFISVPNDEYLEFSNIFCPKCSGVFHAYGHLNSFSADDLKRLLDDEFNMIWQTELGKKVKVYNHTLLRLRHKYARKYFAPSEYTVCPHCGNKEFEKIRGNFLSKIINGLNIVIPRKVKCYWLIALFERKQTIGSR